MLAKPINRAQFSKITFLPILFALAIAAAALLTYIFPLTLQGLGFFGYLWLGGGGFDSTPLAKISDNDAIHLKLGTLIL